MDNNQKASNLLNIFTSDKVKKCVINKEANLELFGEYVVRLSREDTNAIYVESMFFHHESFTNGDHEDDCDFTERLKWHGMEYVLVREAHRAGEDV